jgi:RNA polymerase sigma-70 factor (ECF subfamily)
MMPSRMATDDAQDGELMSRVAAGDADAFAQLFRRRQGVVYRFVLHMTASPSIAEDVTQDVFVTVMSEAARYDSARAPVSAWLCGIARNHVRRRAERDRLLQPLIDDESGSEVEAFAPALTAGTDTLGDLTRAESVEALRQAVLTLPVRYREAVVLCDLQEMSYADAAAAVGCAVGTIRSRLHRGRALLAVKLTAREEERTVSTDDVASSRAVPSRTIPNGTAKIGRSLRSARNLA